jgi:hypothetical protein
MELAISIPFPVSDIRPTRTWPSLKEHFVRRDQALPVMIVGYISLYTEEKAGDLELTI